MKRKVLGIASIFCFSIILSTGCGSSDSSTPAPPDPPVVSPNAPVITTISPASGPISGGTVVTITGSNFDSQTIVAFGGVSGTNFSVSTSATQQSITVTTPANLPGLSDVKITNVNGLSATQTGAFTFQAPAPTITQVSPSQGSISGGAIVTITGSGFFCKPVVAQDPTVTVGSSAAVISSCSINSLTVTAPPGAVGSVSVAVHNNISSNTNSPAISSNSFTYLNGATITSVTRDAGSNAGGTHLSILGSGFSAGLVVVKFGNTGQLIATPPTDTRIDITTLPHAVPPSATDCRTSGMPTIAVSPGCNVDILVTVNGIPAVAGDPQHPPFFDFEPAPHPVTGGSPGIYATFDFENSTLGPFSSDSPSNLSFGTVTSHSGNATNIALRTSVTTGFGGNAARFQYQYGINPVNGPTSAVPTAVPSNPPVSEPTGLYQRWYLMIPDNATLSNTVNTTTCISTFGLSVSTCGQIKLLLTRYPTQTATTAGWFHLGTGADFGTFTSDPITGINVTTKQLNAFRDFAVDFLAPTLVPPNLSATPGTRTGFQLKTTADTVTEWHELQTWYRRTGGVGYVKLWVDGKLLVDAADPLLGSDDATQRLTFEAGIAFTQFISGPITIYVDDAAVGNGYFEAAP